MSPVTFDMTLYAEQYMGPGPASVGDGVVLENKDSNDHWQTVIDGTWGLLTWDGAGNYHVRAWGLTGANDYRVQAWDGPTDIQIAWIGSTFTTPTAVDATGTYGDFGHVQAKYWLRETTAWDNTLTLWEANLMN